MGNDVGLRQRTSTKPVSKANMEKALDRIRDELLTLINNNPQKRLGLTAGFTVEQMVNEIRALWKE